MGLDRECLCVFGPWDGKVIHPLHWYFAVPVVDNTTESIDFVEYRINRWRSGGQEYLIASPLGTPGERIMEALLEAYAKKPVNQGAYNAIPQTR